MHGTWVAIKDFKISCIATVSQKASSFAQCCGATKEDGEYYKTTVYSMNI